MTDHGTATEDASAPTRGDGPPPRQFTYRPALDGVRALAVIAVLVSHHYGAVDPGGWASGGFLGVDLFFVLSGFLITSLLFDEFGQSGRISLPGFWARRVRRLVPPLIVLFLGVAAYAVLRAPPGAMARIRDGGIATYFYVQNWHLIVAAGGSGSPFTPMWSLAIEEQWYLVWPPLVLLLAAGARLGRKAFLGVVVGLAAISALEMALRYDGPASVRTLYHATDTRAQSLLVGAGLALLLGRTTRVRGRSAAAALEAAGIVALGALVVLCGQATGDSPWLYRGGFLGVALLSAIFIAAAAQPSSPFLGRALSFRPVRWLGLISYEVYLFHRLVYRWFPPATVHLSVHALFALRVAVTLIFAAAVFAGISRPIRHSRSSVPLLIAVAFAALLVVVGVTESRSAAGVPAPRGAGFCRQEIVGSSPSVYSGWKTAMVLPSGSLNQADCPMPAVVTT